MPTEWAEGILLAELSDEPELSEEFSAIFARIITRPGEAPAGAVPHVVLNFSGVSYLNSSHIAAMLRMRKRLLEARKTLVLCSLGDEVWSMMLLTGLDKVFQFSPDTMTALARVQLEQEGGGEG